MSEKRTKTDPNAYRSLFVIIAYDIASDKRRNRVINLLKNHGYRVNFSVFECMLNKLALQKLKNDVLHIINPAEDSVLYYSLCKGCLQQKEKTGINRPEYIENLLFL